MFPIWVFRVNMLSLCMDFFLLLSKFKCDIMLLLFCLMQFLDYVNGAN